MVICDGYMSGNKPTNYFYYFFFWLRSLMKKINIGPLLLVFLKRRVKYEIIPWFDPKIIHPNISTTLSFLEPSPQKVNNFNKILYFIKNERSFSKQLKWLKIDYIELSPIPWYRLYNRVRICFGYIWIISYMLQ